MSGLPIDMANAALLMARATADRLAGGSLEPNLAAKSMTDSLDVTSACMEQMTAGEAHVTRQRIADTQNHIWGLFHEDPRAPLKAWARHTVSRLGSIARSGL